MDKAGQQGLTQVYVMGMLHGGHRTSKAYPLSLIRQTVENLDPDVIISELPKSRYREALDSYRRTGTVTERRALAFPEYSQVIIPMTRTHKFELVGAAAWTPQIAARRSEVEARLAADPSRAEQWRAWEAAQAQFRKTVDGRADDPRFLHSDAFDEAAQRRFMPYVRYFERDLGASGWDAINAAHWRNIAAELDRIKGQGKRVLITFGALHKHRILAALKKRDDVIVGDIAPCFDKAVDN